MMSTSATLLKKTELFDLYVRKFDRFADMHRVQLDRTCDLPDFMQKLSVDRYFAMDFWAYL